MLKKNQILCTLIALAASVLNLTGCGQTGALYLPDTPSAPSPAPAPAQPSP